MDTELLRTFLEVRNTRHFGRAASNLFLTQAAVSARIRQLEAALGVTLFVRERNNIRLSSEGERLVPHAETVLMALARARRDMSLEDPGAYPVSVLVRSGLWMPVLQEKLDTLLAAQPDLLLRLDSRQSDVIVRMLLDRAADIALLLEPPDVPELEFAAVGDISLRLYSSRRRDTVQRALAGNYVYLNWGRAFARFHSRQFGEHGVTRLQTNMTEVARDHVVKNGGACYLPESQRRSLADSGLHPVPDAPEFERQLHMTWHASAVRRDVLEGLAEGFSGLRV
ncbi:MAG: LysR family transcriptional regulator [Chromatocurvus sp.]